MITTSKINVHRASVTLLVVLLCELDELALAHIVAKPKPLLAHARADLDSWLQVCHALAICSCLHDWNNWHILSIVCTFVSLFFEEVWRDMAWYWAQERGEGLT